MSETFRAVVLIPTYDNPATIGPVVERVLAQHPDVIVIDDGSGPEGRAACEAVAEAGLAHVVHREANGGKGAAVKTGFEEAQRRGYTHAVQVDADGQHTIEDIPRFLEVAEAHPEAMVLSYPVLDETAPAARRFGRKISVFWVNLETGGRVIDDPLCGFRVYPLEAATAVNVRGERMDFDPEIAVRMAWHGVPVINLPTRARYLTAEEGGVSHFHAVRDNVRISLLHSRLCIEKIFGLFLGRRRRGRVLRLESGA